jgi:sugar/nucleoside kinase (ribokinase family)
MITGSVMRYTSDLNNFDGIMINMITGFDITLAQLEEIRNNYKGLIYFDVHTFSRGLNEKMEREFRLIPEFDKWLSYIDILQVNTRELFTIADLDNKEGIISYVLGTNVKYLLETQGDKGAVCYSIKDGRIFIREMPALKTNVKNQVGLGDVFGAVFFYTYIKNGSVESALKYAVTASGYAASYGNMNDFNKLKSDVFSRNN